MNKTIGIMSLLLIFSMGCSLAFINFKYQRLKVKIDEIGLQQSKLDFRMFIMEKKHQILNEKQVR